MTPIVLYDAAMEDSDIRFRLRPANLLDARFLGEMLRDVGILRTSGVDRPIARSRLLIWWRLQKKFVDLSCIEADSRRIGFIGSYNVRRDSAEISLAIFRHEDRRRGYGTKAFSLFIQNLPSSFPNRLIVRVLKDNEAALSFWTKLGFRELNASDTIVLMSIELNSHG